MGAADRLEDIGLGIDDARGVRASSALGNHKGGELARVCVGESEANLTVFLDEAGSEAECRGMARLDDARRPNDANDPLAMEGPTLLVEPALILLDPLQHALHAGGIARSVGVGAHLGEIAPLALRRDVGGIPLHCRIAERLYTWHDIAQGDIAQA